MVNTSTRQASGHVVLVAVSDSNYLSLSYSHVVLRYNSLLEETLTYAE